MISTPLDQEFAAVLRLRDQGGAYLASNTMGIIPTCAITAEQECLVSQSCLGIQVWDDGLWMDVLKRYAGVIARYLKVEPDQVCPLTNITDGLWRVFSSLRYGGGRRTILQTAMEFTTQEYAAFGFEALGAEVVTVPSDPGHTFVPTERLIAAIRLHRPLVVNLSHAAFESSYVHDLAAISQACREVDAVFCLDAAQTGFVMPLTLEGTGADVILLQQHKWGCAGTGAACMVATREFLRSHEPVLAGWMSHGDPFGFHRGPVRWADHAWRFIGGTPDVPSKARGAAAAEVIVDHLGIEAVWAHNQKLVDLLHEGLSGAGYAPLQVPRRAGFVAVACSSAAEAHGLERSLRERHLVIDSRGSRLRIGPTFYNNQADIHRLVSAMTELRARR